LGKTLNKNKKMAYKMNGFSGFGNSPAKKELIGGQKNLPEELKAKIEAAPGKMYGKKSPAKQKKADKKLPKKVTAKDYIIQDVSEIQKDDKGLYVTGLDDGSFLNNTSRDTSYLPPNATLYNEEGGKKYKEGDYLDETDFEENYFGYDHSKKKAKNTTPKKKK
tara:strand:+ start:625 stop:1113 length:489 start_codon:yes stop_codon:yes gene_type:complete